MNWLLQSLRGWSACAAASSERLNAGLIAAIERGQIDGLHGGVQLALMLGRRRGRAVEQHFGRLNFAAEGSGVRLPGIVHLNLRALKASGRRMKRHLDGDHELLAGRGLIGQQDGVKRAPFALRHQSAVDEDAPIVGKAWHDFEARAVQIFAAGRFGNGEGGAIPRHGLAGLPLPPASTA